MTTSSIKGVIFDLDGTLVQFPLNHLLETAKSVFAAIGIEGIEEVQMRRYFAQFDFFGVIPNELRSECAELLAKELEIRGHPLLSPFKDTFDVLDNLAQAKYQIAIATARAISEVELLGSLSQVDLASYFSCIVTRGLDSSDWKDKGPQIAEVCQRLGLSPEELCFVGDIPSDIESAKAAGIKLSIATSTGGILPEVLAASKPDALVESLSEILPIIKGS